MCVFFVIVVVDIIIDIPHFPIVALNHFTSFSQSFNTPPFIGGNGSHEKHFRYPCIEDEV